MNDEEWWLWPVLGLFGLFGLVKFWQMTARPWIGRTWTNITAGEATLTVPGVGALDDTDLIGLGLLAVVFISLLVAGAARVRRWRARRDGDGDGEGAGQPPSKPQTKRGAW